MELKLKLWQKGDWAAYFGLLANNLTNLLTMISLLLFVVGFPEEIVYGRIVPGFGLGIFLASCCYFVFGYFLAKKTGRTDITALPSGPSAPSIFTVTFLVIGYYPFRCSRICLACINAILLFLSHGRRSIYHIIYDGLYG
ncbi:hypothetical protein J7E79_21285 [Bacillus sp. ISL-40]|uniref:hypothetical protein n=1 Tax=unclassified Bacillus (in: firmicutes) TaxID=185979 RepID=UPI001BE61E11|nr:MULTISPECIES: hypothetical protein [unclassified Bacillus (in: firmicutes)]MBT2699902.1 hypothetical protein [Bacillus sp. ISL-40]MBT2722921.1 hypothetical protein [Bacillus sp. ISL-46]MBT2743793.1 hypothetical protein [Bacillus sp. ISL-77]